MERITRQEFDKLPDSVTVALVMMMDSTLVLDDLCKKPLSDDDDLAMHEAARFAFKAANKVLGYCNTPNVDASTKAKLRKLVWSRTHAC